MAPVAAVHVSVTLVVFATKDPLAGALLVVQPGVEDGGGVGGPGVVSFFLQDAMVNRMQIARADRRAGILI